MVEELLKDVATVKVSSVDKKIREGEQVYQVCNYMDVYNNERIRPDPNFMRASCNAKEFEKFKLKLHDVIITKDSETQDDIGKAAFVDTKLDNVICGYHLAVISPSEEVFGPFLCRLINSRSVKDQFTRRAQGLTRFGLTLPTIENVKVKYPPLPEQKKIADILSTVDDAIQNTKAQIEKTKELKKGLMQKLFSEGIGHTEFKDSKLGRIPKKWEVVRLGELATKIGSGVTPKGGSASYLSEGIPLIRSQNVVNGPIKWKNMAFIDQEQHDKMKGSKLQPNDVLLNISGASIGRTAIVPKDLFEANVNQHVCIIRPKSEVNYSYLKEYLSSNQGQNQVWKFQAGGNREGLNFQQIRSFWIPLPKLNEQKKIASIFMEINLKFNSLKTELTIQLNLKKGLMQKLLSGEVRVNLNVN